jgi:hypothetical protein
VTVAVAAGRLTGGVVTELKEGGRGVWWRLSEHASSEVGC